MALALSQGPQSSEALGCPATAHKVEKGVIAGVARFAFASVLRTDDFATGGPLTDYAGGGKCTAHSGGHVNRAEQC